MDILEILPIEIEFEFIILIISVMNGVKFIPITKSQISIKKRVYLKIGEIFQICRRILNFTISN